MNPAQLAAMAEYAAFQLIAGNCFANACGSSGRSGLRCRPNRGCFPRWINLRPSTVRADLSGDTARPAQSCPSTVILSGAKDPPACTPPAGFFARLPMNSLLVCHREPSAGGRGDPCAGLLRRCAPRNDRLLFIGEFHASPSACSWASEWHRGKGGCRLASSGLIHFSPSTSARGTRNTVP
jgi:hypothetical protein